MSRRFCTQHRNRCIGARLPDPDDERGHQHGGRHYRFPKIAVVVTADPRKVWLFRRPARQAETLLPVRNKEKVPRHRGDAESSEAKALTRVQVLPYRYMFPEATGMTKGPETADRHFYRALPVFPLGDIPA